MDDLNPDNNGRISANDDKYSVLLKRIARSQGYGPNADGTGTGSTGAFANIVQQNDVTVGTTSTSIAPAASSSRTVTVTHPGGSVIVYVAVGRAATVGSGVPLYPGGSWTSDPTSGAINGIVASGTEVVTPFY